MKKNLFLFLALFVLVSAYAQKTDQHTILVFTKTAGFRHKAIEAGVTLFKKLGKEHQFKVIHSEDGSVFNAKKLKSIELVVFLNTTGNVLNEKQQVAFESYIQNGGSFMGIHAAADTEYGWPWYGKLVGAYFKSHPPTCEATVKVMDGDHISTKHLPDSWQRTDEWYNYKNINPDITILLNLDESTYTGGTNGKNHPIAWVHKFDGGRVFYTGGGHTEASYKEENFVKHLLGGIQYCLDK